MFIKIFLDGRFPHLFTHRICPLDRKKCIQTFSAASTPSSVFDKGGVTGLLFFFIYDLFTTYYTGSSKVVRAPRLKTSIKINTGNIM